MSATKTLVVAFCLYFSSLWYFSKLCHSFGKNIAIDNLTDYLRSHLPHFITFCPQSFIYTTSLNGFFFTRVLFFVSAIILSHHMTGCHLVTWLQPVLNHPCEFYHLCSQMTSWSSEVGTLVERTSVSNYKEHVSLLHFFLIRLDPCLISSNKTQLIW